MNKFSFRFYLYKKNEKETWLSAILSFRGKKHCFNMNEFRIEPCNWIPEMQRANKNVLPIFNARLDKIETDVKNYFESNPVIDIERAKTTIRKIIKGESVNDINILNYRYIYINSKSKATKKVYLKLFNKYFDYSYISDVNLLELKTKLQGKKPQTVKNVILTIIAFLHWLRNNKIYNADILIQDIKNINRANKVSKEKNHLIALSEQELDMIDNVELSEKHDLVRDSFLLQCYTGQRYSDKIKINKNTVKLFKEPINNIYGYIELVSKKTKTYVKIPIIEKAYNILMKYPDFNIPFRNNQMEIYIIKKICEKAGLTENIVVDTGDNQKLVPKFKLIGTHTARRTFITLMLKKKAPLKAIMDVAGIRELNTIMNYQKLLKDESAQMIADAFS